MSDLSTQHEQRPTARRRWGNLSIVRPAAVTLRGLAEVDPKDPGRVVAIYEWTAVSRRGPDCVMVRDAEGRDLTRDGRRVRFCMPHPRQPVQAAMKLRQRAIRRGFADGTLNLADAFVAESRLIRAMVVALSAGISCLLLLMIMVTVREVAPFFDRFTLPEKVLTCLAVLMLGALIPLMLGFGVRHALIAPLRNVRRATWTARTISAELTTGERVACPWRDLEGATPHLNGYRLRFRDGTVLGIPLTDLTKELVRVVQGVRIDPYKELRKLMWRFGGVNVVVMNIMAGVATAGAAVAHQPNAIPPLQRYLMLGVVAPLALFVLIELQLRYFIPWQVKLGRNELSRRVRRRLRYDDARP